MTIDTNATKVSFNLMESIVLVFPASISVSIIVVGILCLQFVIFPFCYGREIREFKELVCSNLW